MISKTLCQHSAICISASVSAQPSEVTMLYPQSRNAKLIPGVHTWSLEVSMGFRT